MFGCRGNVEALRDGLKIIIYLVAKFLWEGVLYLLTNLEAKRRGVVHYLLIRLLLALFMCVRELAQHTNEFLYQSIHFDLVSTDLFLLFD
jgi:hypothetical protein